MAAIGVGGFVIGVGGAVEAAVDVTGRRRLQCPVRFCGSDKL